MFYNYELQSIKNGILEDVILRFELLAELKNFDKKLQIQFINEQIALVKDDIKLLTKKELLQYAKNQKAELNVIK